MIKVEKEAAKRKNDTEKTNIYPEIGEKLARNFSTYRKKKLFWLVRSLLNLHSVSPACIHLIVECVQEKKRKVGWWRRFFFSISLCFSLCVFFFCRQNNSGRLKYDSKPWSYRAHHYRLFCGFVNNNAKYGMCSTVNIV